MENTAYTNELNSSSMAVDRMGFSWRSHYWLISIYICSDNKMRRAVARSNIIDSHYSLFAIWETDTKRNAQQDGGIGRDREGDPQCHLRATWPPYNSSVYAY